MLEWNSSDAPFHCPAAPSAECSPLRIVVGVLRVLFTARPIEESDEERPGLILDYDSDGNVVGIELLNASERVENPFEYATKG